MFTNQNEEERKQTLNGAHAIYGKEDESDPTYATNPQTNEGTRFSGYRSRDENRIKLPHAEADLNPSAVNARIQAVKIGYELYKERKPYIHQ